MHKTLIKMASNEQLRTFVDDALTMLKETNPETYEELETYLYKEIYGKHFSDWLLEKATKNMVNEDGTKGAHWNVEQTSSVARSNGISFDTFNEYDWNYVMNMMYSDYYGAISNDTNAYVRLAKKFLEDKDAKEGKALCYYLAMK
jgi:hypothetical protein